MPQALAAFLVTAIGVTGVAATIATIALTIGISIGLSMLAMSVFGPKRPKPSDGQQTIRGGVTSRKRHYGIVHTAGTLSFFESANGLLAQVVTLGTGEEGPVLEHRINNKVVTLDGSGLVTDPRYRGAISIHTRPGADDQTAIDELTALFPQWTTNHRQRGCAHAAILAGPVKQKYFSEVYNGQMPAYTQARKAVRCYDPRKDSTAGGVGSHRLNDSSTWEWTDNGPLVIADFVAHPDGYGLGYDNVNWPNIAAEATIADQNVTTITGEVIKRWRLWASYALADEERRQVLADMQKAIDAFCWQDADFKFNLVCGRFEEPDLIITDDHIKSMNATIGPKAQERVSALKMLYTEAAIGWREQESATVAMPGVTSDPNTQPQAMQLFYAPHHNQAVRIGKLTAARLGPRWRIDATLNLFGLNLLGRRFCRLVSHQLGVDAFFAIDGGVKLTIGEKETTVGAQLVEVRAEDWEFDATTEEGTPPITPEEGSVPVVVPVPTGLALSAVQIALGETYGVAIEANWDEPDRPDLAFQARYRPTGTGTWTMMAVDNDAFTARSGPVDSGVEYEVQIRALTITYRESDWSAAVTITPVAETAIGAPTGLQATGGVGEADVRFRMSTDASLAFVRLYHNGANNFGTATQVGADIEGGLGEWIEVTDSGLSSGAQYYWARAYNGTGGSSVLAGPVSTTIS